MPRKGENIYKRKDGRWEGRYIKSRTPAGKANYGYVYIERLTELIGQMKPKYRDPLRLLAMGYTNREIAKSLGLTDEVVRTRLFRGRKLLWKELSNHE